MNSELLKSRILISTIKDHDDGSVITLSGYVTVIRSVSKNLKFLVLEDRSGTAQLIFKRGEVPETLIDLVDELAPQSVIAIKGKVKYTDKTVRGVEVIVSEMEILSKVEKDLQLPIEIDASINPETGMDMRLNWRFLDLRSEKRRHIFSIQTDFLQSSRSYFVNHDFIEIMTPKLVGMPSEGGSEVFSIDYFGEQAYLAQSPQLYKQMAICAGFERVFEIAPVFRANPSFTSRHDTEFTSLDIEMGYINSVDDVMTFENEWLSYSLQAIQEKWQTKILELFDSTIIVPETIPRITFDKAFEIVESMDTDLELKYGEDIGTQGEKLVGKYIAEEFGSEFVFITDYPTSVRPFYHMRNPSDPEKTFSYDLLWKGIEITTGAQREHRYDLLKFQAEEMDMDLSIIQFYLDFFKYGAPPHGGFGLSPSRVIMLLLSLSNVREATLLPRDPKRLFP